MEEITFQISECQESGWLIASWDAPNHGGGITTQARNLRELEQNIREAVDVHFDEGASPAGPFPFRLASPRMEGVK